jgi:NAD(P) transhydrogenase
LKQAGKIPRRVVVVGAGVIGLEYASMFTALNIDVTIIDQRPTILDFVDREIIEALCYHMHRQGATFRLGEKVVAVTRDSQDRVVVVLVVHPLKRLYNRGPLPQEVPHGLTCSLHDG